MSLRSTFIAIARAHGFDAVGFATAAPLEKEAADLLGWLDEGRHAGMEWMAREPDKRCDPTQLLADVRTVMVLGVNYYTNELPEAKERRIARYARGRDYHNVLKKRLRKMIRAFEAAVPGLRAKTCVDTSPILEKPWAQRAGLGWQGKHTHLVSRRYGNWLLLAVVLLNVEVAPDLPHPDLCGTCTACIEACPTGALGPHKLDARRCISYWTIEHRGPFPTDAPPLHGWAHGCDLCLEACPWNRFSLATHWAEFRPRYTALPEGFEANPELFVGTALSRPGIAGLLRNVTAPNHPRA